MAKTQSEGLVQHLVGVRYQLRGDGILQTRSISYQEARDFQLPNLTMQNVPNYLPYRLANFRSQGMQLELLIDDIDYTFTLSRLVAYIKPTTAGVPLL